MVDVSKYNITELATMALQKPEDFGYWGNEDMFVTWGFTGIDKHRDSGILVRSNFEVITNDLIKKYPDDFTIEGFGHWAVGHVDRLTCRILKNKGGITEDNITDAFKEVIDWQNNLDMYPIADETHYSDLEFEECIEVIKDIPSYLLDKIDTSIESWAVDVYHELINNMYIDFYPDSDIYPKDTDILVAVYNIGLWNKDNIDEWEDFCLEQNLQYPPKQKNPNQLSLFEEN